MRPRISFLILIFIVTVSLLATGCRPKEITTGEPATPTQAEPTATQTPLPTAMPTMLPPTATPVPATATPTPAPIVGVYFDDVSTKKQTAANFLQLYPDGKATYTEVKLDPEQNDTYINLYKKYASQALEVGSENGKTGEYALDGDKLTLTFNPEDWAYLPEATFTDEVVTLQNKNKKPFTFESLPEGITGTWYAVRDTADGLFYDYIRFFEDGTLTAYEHKMDKPAVINALGVYGETALPLLVANPPSPASVGTYILQGDKIVINWNDGKPALTLSGAYSPDKITLDGEEDTAIEFTPVPELLSTVFYRELANQSGYAYLQFYPDRSVSFVEIFLGANESGTARDVYEQVAMPLLKRNPSVPAAGGSYTVNGKELKVVFPAGYPLAEMDGLYSPDKIVVNGTENDTWEFLPLPGQ